MVLATKEDRADKFFCGQKPELRNKIIKVPKSAKIKVIDSATTKELVFEYDPKSKGRLNHNTSMSTLLVTRIGQ